ncbi:GDSL lipase-like [Rutidosis leptorrhynchoides]|uniref:GDSL lipase-like n=1 Tax=Rutidosis leptorrhynchoides TaxID=125765 RepID=UPI003A9942A2
MAVATTSSSSSKSEAGIAIALILCLSISKSCSTPSQGHFVEHVALFVFGDSLFDPGNNNYINTTTDFQANHWPYGQSYFNPPSGRFSDGRLIPDFIAEYAGLPFIPAYLEPANNEFTHGANFASGGAGALVETHAGFVVDLQTQLRYFGELENYYRLNLGDAKARQLLSNAVYLLSCGGNDYQYFGKPYTKEQYVDMVIGNMTNVVKGIYEKGGRKFGFVTAPLIGCWPAIRIQQPGHTCNEEINDVARLHNQALARQLQNLEKQLEGFVYSKFDISTSINDRMKNPSKYGFKEGELACCGSGPFRGIYSCGGMRGRKEYQVCDNATEHLFFDSFHPNELASRQFADLFWDGDTKVTAPYNLKQLFEGKTSTTSVPNDEL